VPGRIAIRDGDPDISGNLLPKNCAVAQITRFVRIFAIEGDLLNPLGGSQQTTPLKTYGPGKHQKRAI
jgi:hypothetical protein